MFLTSRLSNPSFVSIMFCSVIATWRVAAGICILGVLSPVESSRTDFSYWNLPASCWSIVGLVRAVGIDGNWDSKPAVIVDVSTIWAFLAKISCKFLSKSTRLMNCFCVLVNPAILFDNPLPPEPLDLGESTLRRSPEKPRFLELMPDLVSSMAGEVLLSGQIRPNVCEAGPVVKPLSHFCS